MADNSKIKIHKIEDHPDFIEFSKIQLLIYKLDKAFICKTELVGHHFQSEWLTLLPDGTIEIPEGYAWNGCSPKISVFDLCVIGTPDGIIDINTMKPKTYYASLVHDALYQYYEWHDILRNEIDQLFLKMMKNTKFRLANIYYHFVRFFGCYAVKEKRKNVEFI